MPDFAVIDAHVHLYDVERLRYGWLKGAPKINRTYLVADFDEARGPVAVERFVFAEVAVDPGLHLAEARFAQDIADHDSRLAGIIAHAPLEKGAAVEADLAALLENRALRGIRRLIETKKDPSFCLEPDFIAAVKLLPRFGLTFDICVKHWAMVFALELARRCPDVGLVLDHIGKPGIRQGLWEPWASQIRELARLPNVAVKLSGVITEADRAHWRKADIMPYLAHVIDCFGFERCLFASDWTVSSLTHAYPVWVGIVDEAIAGASLEEQRQLYRETARRVYRLA